MNTVLPWTESAAAGLPVVQRGEAMSRRDIYFISMAAEIVGLHAQTLRKYERLGLIALPRKDREFRLYSDEDIRRLQQIKRLVEDKGLNLAGLKLALRASDSLARLEELGHANLDARDLKRQLQAECRQLRELLGLD